MTWPWNRRGFPNRDTHDRRVVRSFLVAEGEAMPNVGDVMVFDSGAVGPFRDGGYVLGYMAARVERVQGRTVWYVPYGHDVDASDVLGASRWKMRRRRIARGRFEEVASRR